MVTTMGTLPVCLEVLVAGVSDLRPAAHMSIRVGVNVHVNIKIGVNACMSIRGSVNAVKHKVINLLKMPCFFGDFKHFQILYYLTYVCACICVSKCYVCGEVPRVRRGQWIPWNWRYRWPSCAILVPGT